DTEAQNDGDPWNESSTTAPLKRAPVLVTSPAKSSEPKATFQVPADAPEAELERKERELREREAKVVEREKNVSNARPPNFPHLKPLVDCFIAFWLSTATYIVNFAATFALLIVKAESAGGTLGFVFWYQPLYSTWREIRSLDLLLLVFFNFSFHLVVSALLAVGIPGWGGAGVIYSLSLLGSNLAVGILCAIASSLFIFEVVVRFMANKGCPGILPLKGLTMEQAKQQAIEGVASSKTGREVAGAALRSAYAAETKK
ncbi:hypothetical protein BC829DRAFT_390865, partial [Chytridium lagenaria]